MNNCCICGLRSADSFEHLPAEKAFNDRRVISYSGQGLFVPGRPVVRKQKQRGAGATTLCEQCNNDTGTWYVPAFLEFVDQAHRLLTRSTNTTSDYCPFHIAPQPIFKQIVAMFMSACGHEFGKSNPELSRFVLNRTNALSSQRYGIYCYYYDVKNSEFTRQSGLSGMLAGGRPYVFSEISYYPLSYIMTVGSQPPDPQLATLNFFRDYGYNDRALVHLRIPTRAVNSPFPADFRTASQMQRIIKKRFDAEKGAAGNQADKRPVT